MLTFFRRIRKSLLTTSSARKYILYALGEVLLVMVGILLALQVNNWNERRKRLEQEAILIDNLMEDMVVDSVAIQILQGDISLRGLMFQELYLASRGVIALTEIENLGLLRWNVGLDAIAKENHPEIASMITSVETRDAIRKYYRGINNMEFVLDEYNHAIVEIVRPYLRSEGIFKSDYFYGRFAFEPIHKNLVEYKKEANRDFGTRYNMKEYERILQTKEFEQVLFEVSAKFSVIKRVLDELEMMNHELMKMLSDFNPLED